ncbi:MAG: hypothetical protein E6R08_10185 [Nevskiaceae bacterium]|nr:MAG: hypothetical protein E6R08_10185 [Nevskiaceae bacterium]
MNLNSPLIVGAVDMATMNENPDQLIQRHDALKTSSPGLAIAGYLCRRTQAMMTVLYHPGLRGWCVATEWMRQQKATQYRVCGQRPTDALAVMRKLIEAPL